MDFMKNIREIIGNREIKRIFDAVIIGLTLLDVILLTGTLFVQVSPETYYIIVLFDLMVVSLLIVQFMYRFYLADDKKKYLKDNWFDIIGMVPEILLGGYSGILRYFRLIKILSLFRRNIISLFEYIERAKLEYGVITLIFIIVSGAVMFYFFEYGVNENVNSLDDALWYILITITTVGYGDIYPHTVGGRFATLIIIVAGLAFVSYAAFKITGLFFEETEEKENVIEEKLELMDKKIDRLQEEMVEIKKILETNNK
ncbi:MAG: Ion channel [Methanobacterium sp. Maddingley MBC34]|nr:MAG: Ion channel [Methanobacterium sp. Maddingley MBC34]